MHLVTPRKSTALHLLQIVSPSDTRASREKEGKERRKKPGISSTLTDAIASRPWYVCLR